MLGKPTDYMSGGSQEKCDTDTCEIKITEF